MLEVISQFSTYQIVILCVCALLIGVNKTALPGIGILPVVLLADTFDSRLSTGMQLLMLAWADIMAVIYFRRSADWRIILRLLPWSLLGLGIGWWILGYIPPENNAAMKLLIGWIVIGLLILNFIRKRLDPEKIPSGIIPSAFYGSLMGSTTMLANAAGPVSAIYLLSMKLPKEQYMGSGAWLFLIVNWIKVPMFWYQGRITREVLLADLWMIPLLVAGGFLGIVLFKRLPQKLFENIVMVLVVVAAVKMILGL
ncbi:MAG: sulfite exporter TauE/SafE family protein [Lentisphaeria bacterium]|nr:sulfite exporter TauE/SafE family protein [Lentisphaeria bacterium]